MSTRENESIREHSRTYKKPSKCAGVIFTGAICNRLGEYEGSPAGGGDGDGDLRDSARVRAHFERLIARSGERRVQEDDLHLPHAWYPPQVPCNHL
jgi:hypothetical protein